MEDCGAHFQGEGPESCFRARLRVEGCVTHFQREMIIRRHSKFAAAVADSAGRTAG